MVVQLRGPEMLRGLCVVGVCKGLGAGRAVVGGRGRERWQSARHARAPSCPYPSRIAHRTTAVTTHFNSTDKTPAQLST
jgi:hypothetical protein